MTIKTCPLQPWFKFEGGCPVKSCKYNNPHTQSKCLALDHKFPGGDKTISDAELQIFKFRDRGEDISPRAIAALRKQITQRVTNVVVLSLLIQYIEDKYDKKTNTFNYLNGTNPSIDKALMRSSLRFKKLGYKTWMLPLLVSNNVWESFCKAQNVSARIKHNNIFLLRPKEFQNFQMEVLKQLKTKPIFRRAQ